MHELFEGSSVCGPSERALCTRVRVISKTISTGGSTVPCISNSMHTGSQRRHVAPGFGSDWVPRELHLGSVCFRHRYEGIKPVLFTPRKPLVKSHADWLRELFQAVGDRTISHGDCIAFICTICHQLAMLGCLCDQAYLFATISHLMFN